MHIRGCHAALTDFNSWRKLNSYDTNVNLFFFVQIEKLHNSLTVHSLYFRSTRKEEDIRGSRSRNATSREDMTGAV